MNIHDQEVAELLETARQFVNKYAPAFLRVEAAMAAIEKVTPAKELQIRVTLACQAIFPQLEAPEVAICCSLLMAADLKFLGLAEALNLPACPELTSARIDIWNESRDAFDRAGIAEKLSPGQMRFAQRFLLSISAPE